MTAGRILIVDDDTRLAGMLTELLVPDVSMPNRDGLDLLRHLRTEGSKPVLIVIALPDEHDRIPALAARLRALLRRSANVQLDSTPLAVGPLAIYPRTMSATLEGAPLRLTTAEFMLLQALARSAGRVQSRETLTYQALGRPLQPFDRSIDTHISNIRRKLCLDPARGIKIKSSRGHGYVLTVPDARA